MKNNNINNTNNNTNNNVKFHFRGPERYYAVAGRQLDEATNDGTDNYLTPQSSPLKVTIITLVVITILAFILVAQKELIGDLHMHFTMALSQRIKSNPSLLNFKRQVVLLSKLLIVFLMKEMRD